jgi:hypothetical protein
MGVVGAHEAGLLRDRDVVVAVEDEPEQRRSGTLGTDDEDGACALGDCAASLVAPFAITPHSGGPLHSPDYAP